MSPDIYQRRFPYVHFRCVQDMTDVARRWMMYAWCDWCRPTDEHMQRLMHANYDRCRLPLRTHDNRCMQEFVDVSWHWQLSFARSEHSTSDAYSTWTMLLSRCAHTMFDVCGPWTISPNVCNYCFPYAHMLPYCVKAMINVIYRWSMSENYD